MAPAPTSVAVCDRGDCPAPAQRMVVLHGQDFYFCGHHTTELTRALGALGAAGVPDATAEARDGAPPARLAKDRVVALGQPT